MRTETPVALSGFFKKEKKKKSGGAAGSRGARGPHTLGAARLRRRQARGRSAGAAPRSRPAGARGTACSTLRVGGDGRTTAALCREETTVSTSQGGGAGSPAKQESRLGPGPALSGFR